MHHRKSLPPQELFQMRPNSSPSTTDTLHFSDGKTKIDMVLAFRDDQDDNGEIHEEDRTYYSAADKRECFERNLRKQGLLLELEPAKQSLDGKTNFLKVSAPWGILKKYAEILNLKMPIKIEEDPDSATCCGAMDKLMEPFNYDFDLIPPEPNFFTAGFIMEREDRYIIKDRDDFFTAAQRSMIVWQILRRTRYDDAHPDKIGIVRLLSSGAYKAAYPLHDGKFTEGDSDRRILYLEWARPSKWFKKQPLWMIKRYFGDKIGLYFAWLGFYTFMLIPAAIFGLIIFIYGVINLYTGQNYPSEEICDKNGVGSTIMCPQCDTYCPFWPLHQSCTLAKFTFLFDNTGTVVFSIFMAFWATTFLELWKRQQAIIAWEWDLSNFEEDEQTRPEYESKVKTTRINPVTKKPEPFLSPWQKAARLVFTHSFVLLMLVMVIMAVIGVMVYRIAVATALYQLTKGSAFYSKAKLMVSLSAATLNLIIIVILNKLYQYVALWLTNLERPRTQTEFEDSYTFKMFLFQFINYYSSLFYIAFFKGKFFSHPGDSKSRENTLTRFSNDICDPAGCFYELCIQLFIIMAGKQIFNNFMELLLPKLKLYWKRYVYRSSVSDDEDEHNLKIMSRWEHDFNLTGVGRLALLDEYLEMVIQYGFVTLFVAAFPLAPLFALINNIIEIRLDAYKFTTTNRRPLAQRAQDIGAWFGILQALTYIAVATNAITIALASDFIPHLVYKYGYSSDTTLSGYIKFSLSAFNTSDWGDPNSPTYPGPEDDKESLPNTCYFKGMREGGPEYLLKEEWYHVLAAKCTFVIVFEHFVLGLTGILAMIVPDVPANVATQMKRERLLAREILFEMDEPGPHSVDPDQHQANETAIRSMLAHDLDAESGLHHRKGASGVYYNDVYVEDS